MLLTFDLRDFDGTWFSAIDQYKSELRSKADDLLSRTAATRSFGDLLSPDKIAAGRAVIESIDVRNRDPIYDPLFLTFLENRQWVASTDRVLCRMNGAFGQRRKAYREFIRYASHQPMGGLFELNVFGALDDAFGPAEPQPRLPSSKKRSDVRVVVDGQPVFVEATVLGESRYWAGQREAHRGQSVWVAPGLGPAEGARRVLSKIAEELAQCTDDSPNILCFSFFDWETMPEARQWAIDDAWIGGPQYGPRADGSRLDVSRIDRVDTILEFGRSALRRVHVNPNTAPACRLPDASRDRVRAALSERFMIR